MILVLDTTALSADAYCAGEAWQSLFRVASNWGIRIAVTEVTLAEAIANHRRSVSTARTALHDWRRKHRVGFLPGLGDNFDATDKVLEAGIDRYAARLRDRFAEGHVEVLEVADIPHMELVRRATERRRPCDDHGDGYRDTLNWLTMLRLAEREPGEQIIWISDNSRDFANDPKSKECILHPHLVEDLKNISAEDRVSWKLTLADAVLALAAEHAPSNEPSSSKARESVDAGTVLKFIQKELPWAVLDRSLSPSRCGLPSGTIAARLESIQHPRDLVLDTENALPGNEAVAAFAVRAGASIQFQQVGSDWGPSMHAPTQVAIKALSFRGLVILDDLSRPTGIEVAGIDALPDDPGLQEWNQPGS